MAAGGFLALLGLGIDASPATKGAREFEGAAGRATRAGEKATDAALKQDRAYRTAAGGTKAFSDALSTLNRVLIVTGLATLLGLVVRTGSAFEDLRARLVTIEGSAAGADAAFRKLQSFAAKTPFELSNATEAYLQLKARGIDPTIERMTAFGDIASSFGRDITDIAAAVGGAITGEMEMLKGFGIVARQQGDQVAFTYNGVTTVVEKNAEAIAGYLQRLGETEFLGGMERRAETLSGKLSTLKDALATTASLVFEAGLGSALKSGVSALTEWINKGNEAIQAVGGLGNVFKLAQVDVLRFAADGVESVTQFAVAVGRRMADAARYVADFFSLFTDNDVARVLNQIPGWNIGVQAMQNVANTARLAASGLDEASNSIAQNGRQWAETARAAADLTLAEVLNDIATAAPAAGKALAEVPPPDTDRERLDKYLKTLQGIREELEDQSAIARIIRQWGVGLETATDVVELIRSSGGLMTESQALEYVRALAEANAAAAIAAGEHAAQIESMVDAALAFGQASRGFDVPIVVDIEVPDAGELIDTDRLGAELKALNEDTLADWNRTADGIGDAFGNAFRDIAYTGKFEFGNLIKDLLSQWIEYLADKLALWIANLAKEAAAAQAFGVASGGSSGGGINAGTVVGAGQGASAAGASAGMIATVGIFAAAAYAWYNDRQHEYERIEGAIRDIENVFQELGDTLGQYLPVLAGQVEVRKDGDRYRSRVGFDDGSAGYAYFDEYGDAIAAATLSGLREALGQADRFYAGPLAHLGESAKAVIAGITDEIIAMGQGGVAWLQEGLELARRLDELGMSDMERQLSELRREYDENIRKAGEYGLSLQKVGDLYQSQLSSLSDSLRARIAQYLPGYDPVGDEFDQIRRDNDAIRAAYERQREELKAHIEQVMKTIERLSAGRPGGSAGGSDPFNNVSDTLRDLMESIVRIGPGLTGGVAVILDSLGQLDRQLNDLSNVATGGGGLSPDAAARIAEQRRILAELMEELAGLGNGGLTDEEINAAEREARRRQNRGNRAAERSAYEDQLRAIADSALPDLVSQLKATQDQIAEVAAEAARLGVNADLSQAALAALNQQLGRQAQDAYLSLAERMARAIGDEETLRDIAELRWELERAEMLAQIAWIEERGLLEADQIERLRALYDRLPSSAPGNGSEPPADVAGGVLSGFGIDLDALTAQVELLRNAASIVDALAGGAKLAIPGLSELRKKIEGLDDAARQFVGDSLFLQFGDQLLAFVERYYGQTAEGEALRTALEQVRFHLELANLNAQFQLLKSLGLLTDQQIAIVEAALGFLNDPANHPDFSLPDTRSGAGGYSAPDPIDDRAAELERFFEALARWEQLGLSDARRELMDLREEFNELRATAIRLGQSVSRVDAAYQTAMADFWDRTLAPYEDRAETASDRLQAVRDHFAELIDLAGEYGGDLERILAAQQQAVADLWDEILGPLRDYQSQLIGSALSGATPEERLLAAQADFQRLADAALSGDVNAIQQLPAAIQALLQEAQSYYGTGAAYQALYSSIQSIIDQILGFGGIAGAGGVIPGDRGPVFDRPGGVDIGGLVPRIPQQPLLPQVPQVAQGESETVRLLKEQLAEAQRINRENARLLTEMVVELRRNREETAEMKRELFALSQVQRRTNTAIEDQARTKATKRSADAA